jgi:hypothetical protein
MSGDRLEHFFRRRAGGAEQTSLRRFSAPYSGPATTSTSLSSDQAVKGLLDAALDNQLKSILFACGDVSSPSVETVDLLKEMVAQHLAVLTHYTLDAAAVHNHGHVIDERHVVAALKDHGHIEAAERVLYLSQRRKAIESMLRVNLGKDEEGSTYSKKDLLPEVLTTAEVENARKELTVREQLEGRAAKKIEANEGGGGGGGGGGGKTGSRGGVKGGGGEGRQRGR